MQTKLNHRQFFKIAPVLSVFVVMCSGVLRGGANSEMPEAVRLYREAFELAGALPRDAGEFVRTATRESVGRLERSLELTRLASRAESMDWGIDWDSSGHFDYEFDLPRKMRNLVRLGLAYHEEKLKRGETANFAVDMLALLQAGHHFWEGHSMIHFLTALATEGLVRRCIATHAGRLPSEVRDELARGLQAMSAGPTLAELFESEAASTRSHLWHVFEGKTDFGENILQEPTNFSSLANRLRVDSIVDDAGEVVAIDFAFREDGSAFRLRPGEIHEDFELLVIDQRAGRALLRAGNRAAVVLLADREVHSFSPEMAWRRIVYWAQIAINFGGQPDGQAENTMPQMLEEARGDSLEAFVRLVALHDAEVAGKGALLTRDLGDLSSIQKTLVELNTFTRFLVQSFLNVRQLEIWNHAERELLLAGLNQLKAPGAALPVSRVTGDPIQVRREGERIILESTLLDTRHGREGPLRLEFPLR